MRNELETICRVFRERGRFLIACHENPEGDAIGSELALALALRKAGKTATVLNSDPVPDNLLFLPGADSVRSEEDGSRYEVAVIVDCGSLERTGRVGSELRKCPLTVNIDHHVTNGRHGDHCLIDPEAAATGVLIYRILSALEIPFDEQIAVNLFVAILTDTGSFRYSNANPEAFDVAGEMVRRGVDPWSVAEQVFETQPRERISLLGRVLASLEFDGDGRIAAITTMRKDLDEFRSRKDSLEGFINYPRSIAGVEIAVAFREEGDGTYRVSLRSKGKVDVARIATGFGGGGHRSASGCSVHGTLPDVKRRVFEALRKALP